MKKLLIAFSFMFAGAVAVNAQQVDTTAANKEGETPASSQYRKDQTDKMAQDPANDQNNEKEKISQDELPALVKEQISSNDYNGWTTENAYRKMKDGKTIYAVELKKGDETKMVKFDEQGNKLKEKDKDDDHK